MKRPAGKELFMTSKNNAFKGFETWFIVVKMKIKMHSRIFFCDLLLCMVIACGIIYYGHGEYVDYVRREMFTAILQLKILTVEADFLQLKNLIVNECYVFIIVISLFGIPYYLIVLRFFKWNANKRINDEYVSGAKIIPLQAIKKQLRKVDTSIPIGSLEMPIDAETKHVFVIGATGAGKTQVMKAAVTHEQRRGAKIIILDTKGDYVPSNFNPTRDLIFCPSDQRSVQWSVFNDVDSVLDIDQVFTHCLIPCRQGSDPFWPMAARAVLKGILFYAWRKSRGANVTNKSIWDLLQSGSFNLSKILREIPEGASGYTMITDPSSKQTQGIIANLLQDLAVMELMARQDGCFSVRKWLHDPNPGTLYLLNPSKSRDVLKPIITLMVDVLSHEILSMKDDNDRRYFLFLDEFGSLFKIPSLIELLTRARSKGASVWLGTQDIGQIELEYGRELLQTIVNNCGSKVMMSVSEPRTAQYVSDMIGDTEIKETTETNTMGPDNLKDGLSLSRNTKTKKLVLPSDLQSLPNLLAIVKFTNFDYTRTAIPYIPYVDRHDFFILRKDMKLPSMPVVDGDCSGESSIYNIKADSPSSPFREF